MDIDSLLVGDEGKRYVAYADPLTGAEPWTIGIGHTGPEVHPGLVWNDDQVDYAYQLDKGAAYTDCLDNFQPWFTQLTEPRQAVLWSMRFQLGLGRMLQFRPTLDNIRDGHYANAAEHMRQSLWGRQTSKRVNRLASILETGNW